MVIVEDVTGTGTYSDIPEDQVNTLFLLIEIGVESAAIK
jgi:hypothetical protein